MDPTEEYLFDLRGYTVIRGALDPDHVAAMNAWIDALPPLDPESVQPETVPDRTVGQWIGNVYTQAYGKVDGINLQDIIETGEIFERLIDHPSWINRVRHYIGPSARPYIHEIFVNLRGPSGYIWPHSGGHAVTHNTRAGRLNGQWVCFMLSVLAPLTDVDAGDGATVLAPSSHWCDIPHPQTRDGIDGVDSPTEELAGAEEIHLKAGDAILFNDCLLHGSARRTNAGQRRMVTIRYTPHTLAHRFNYQVSEELEARLTPERLAIVQPMKARRH